VKRFTRLYLDLDATNASAEKASLIGRYLAEVGEEEAGVAVYFLAGERLERTASTALLKRAALEATGLPEWMLGVCYEAVGDLSETVALLRDAAGEAGRDGDQGQRDAPGETLDAAYRERLRPFELATDEAERERILLAAWRELDAEGRFVFHKLIRGGFRVGVQRKTVANAIADLTGLPVGLVTQRMSAGLEPSGECFRRIVAPEGAAADASAPLPFCLANQLDTPRDSGDDGPNIRAQARSVREQLGDRTEYQAEWKYDGVRCQLIRPAEDNGQGAQTVLWSRGEELVTHQFPEIVAAARSLPPGLTLDGEVLLVDGSGLPLPFAELQTRLNRKPGSLVQPSLFDDRRAVFIAYDALREAGEDLRDRPTRERRGVLERALNTIGDDTALRLAPVLDEGSWEALAGRRAESRGLRVEGLMLKHNDAPYHAGRTRSGPTWWKWKIDPLSVDAVLIYAQAGSGRRATLFTDYTFGLWDADARTGEPALVPFAKAYSGLTNDEIERVDKFVRDHTEERMGPVRRVTPGLVFEIGYEGVRESDRHSSGLAVRFPRMLRWRRDKKPEDADRLDAVRAQLP